MHIDVYLFIYINEVSQGRGVYIVYCFYTAGYVNNLHRAIQAIELK